MCVCVYVYLLVIYGPVKHLIYIGVNVGIGHEMRKGAIREVKEILRKGVTEHA